MPPASCKDFTNTIATVSDLEADYKLEFGYKFSQSG